MLSNKYLQIQPYDASKIFKHRKWVQRSPGLWWNVPSGLPRSHGGPNFGRRLARGQLRLCVGGPSSLVGAGEIWALTNCLEMFLGFPRSFGEKTAGRSGFGTTFWWFFRWCVCFVWKNRWQKCGKFHVHQEKNNFSGKANQNGNIGGIEPKIWVCIEFVSISRRTQIERNWLGEIGSAKYWKKIQQKNKLEANQQLKHHGTWDEHTVGRIWRHQYAKNVMSAADWGNCSGHLPRICYIWWWVCVCILSICYCMTVWCRQSASQSFHLDAAHRLAEAKIGLPASTRIWWKGQILGCCENVLLSPLLVLQIPDIFRRSSGLVKPPSTISNQSPCNHYLILLALLMGMFPTCVLKCVKGFQEWTIASPRKSGSFGGISGHVAPLCPHQPAV